MKYYASDPEAHPFKANPPTHKPRLQWVHPKYLVLPEEEANVKRQYAITSPEMVDAIEKLSKIIGPEATGKYFGKFFENLKLEELSKGHYEVK